MASLNLKRFALLQPLLFLLFLTFLLSSLFTPLVTSAQSEGTITYKALAPIPALGITSELTVGKDDALVVYFNSIVKMMIALATGLAVLYMIYGGVLYSSEAFTKKGEGKATMVRALQGLLLALVSWLILNTLNPLLLTGKINGLIDVGVAPVGGGGVGDQSGITAVTGGSGGTGSTGTPGSGTDLTRSATFNGGEITYFGGMEDVRTDANGNVINPNGGTAWNEPASVASAAAGHDVYLRNYDPATQYYSAYPLSDKASAIGLPVFADTGTANKQLSNYYLAYDNRSTGGNLVYTEIIDRGPGNENASLDTSRKTLNSLGGSSAKPTVYLVNKQGNTVGIQQ